MVYNLKDGNFRYNIWDDFPDGVYTGFQALERRINEGEDVKLISAEKVLTEIIEEETTLSVNPEKLAVFPLTTRKVLSVTLKGGFKSKAKIALPVPNWGFWHELEGQGDTFVFQYFEAWNEEQLIDNFQTQARTNKLDGLLLVNPANPLGYMISEEGARAINTISEHFGIPIIVDDVLRGNLPLENRNSLGAYFTYGIVVEGMSHRFGSSFDAPNPVAHFSYILLPKQSESTIPKNDVGIIGEILARAYRYSNKKTLEELERRNDALDQQLHLAYPQVEIVRPCPASITSLIKMPDIPLPATVFSGLLRAQGVSVSPLEHYVPKDLSLPQAERYFRVSVGMETVQNIAKAAQIIGENLGTKIVRVS